jgi:hypothetical protein
VSKTLPKAGDAFVLGQEARHHAHLRPLIGHPGCIKEVVNEGAIVGLAYPGLSELVHVTTSLGRIGPVPGESYDGPLRSYTVRLPLPPACASPNARVDHRAAASAKRGYRELCAQQIIAAGVPTLRLPISVSLEYYLFRPADAVLVAGRYFHPKNLAYPRDLDNARACAKGAQDALQDAGVIASDGAAFVLIGDTTIYSRMRDHNRLTCLDLTIREECAAE